MATTTSHSGDKSSIDLIPSKDSRMRTLPTKYENDEDYYVKSSPLEKRRATETVDDNGSIGPAMTTLFVGISAIVPEPNSATIAIAIRDTVYLQDFCVKTIQLSGTEEDRQKSITDYIIGDLSSYERRVFTKFIGAGIPHDLAKIAPKLTSRLWLELDIIPITQKVNQGKHEIETKRRKRWSLKSVDEQADSMARKCMMYFGPSLSPLLQVGYQGLVEVDASFRSHMCSLSDYKTTCGNKTWESMLKFSKSLKKRGTKIAFFSSTPQGGGVALMRHALVRFSRVMGVDLTWYVPKPKPGVFRITKNVHNILQGVAGPEEKISVEEKARISEWINENANRYWLSEGGPLQAPAQGGANIVIIDDPQMPGLIPLAKKACPGRPVLYRSHIEIRSDLATKEGSPQADIWKFLWNNIQHTDMFISHPMLSFIPKNVPQSKVAFLPATTDWLDGLNKPMNDWDKAYYSHLYNLECLSMGTMPLRDTKCKYFIQVARFDPSKGIPDVIKSYAEFHRLLKENSDETDLDQMPQLLIVGNSSIDDPDGIRIYNQAMQEVATNAPDLAPLISISRLQPNDQLLNTLLSNSHTVLQLSTREGFEVKVSEAIHKRRPVIATRTGGIPLQVQDGKNGFLVEPGDWKSVGKRLLELWTDTVMYDRMSEFAAKSVSDEVGTVGNALAWFYLADKWAAAVSENGEHLEPDGRWVNDLARMEAGCPYVEGENRLPRESTLRH